MRSRFRFLGKTPGRIPWVLGAGALGALAVLWAWIHRTGTLPARFRAEPAFRADVLLVPSGDRAGHRTLRAVELLRAGRADWLLISGQGAGGDSSRYLRALALRSGAPAERVLVEPKATTTWENVLFSVAIFDRLKASRVWVVTSRFHARRAALVAERLLPGREIRVEPVDLPVRVSLTHQWVEGLKTLRYAWLGRISLMDLM